MVAFILSSLVFAAFSVAVPDPRNLYFAPGNSGNYILPPLPYDFNALEPYISTEIMTIHHDKHHATYVSNLNNAIPALETARRSNDILGIIAAESTINFNGGGHINHSLFWENLAKSGTAPPSSDSVLIAAIVKKWGSVSVFTETFNTKLATLQGSGWGWLVKDDYGELDIIIKANQDPVLAPLVPIIGVDAWEHGYYLQYKNDRNAYLKAIWNVINWDVATRRYTGKKIIKRAEFNNWVFGRS